jgi:hypothetical protein
LNNNHNLDGTTGSLDNSKAIQLDESVNYRPAIKCIEGSHGNPISCDYDDIEAKNEEPLFKDPATGLTSTKIILGGPTVDNSPPPPKKEVVA